MHPPRKTYKQVRRGEVYTLTYEFPHEREAEIPPKERPVLVLSDDKHNLNIYYPTVIVAPISTLKATTKKYDTDLWVTAEESGLSEDSRILLAQIQTYLKDELLNLITTLSDDIMEKVDAILALNLGIIGT